LHCPFCCVGNTFFFLDLQLRHCHAITKILEKKRTENHNVSDGEGISSSNDQDDRREESWSSK